jgi:hypothetical protein
MEKIIKESNLVALCVTIILVSVIGAAGWYNINDRILMSKNISEAVAKGMDPLAVRCSYANERDVICVALAASGKK